MQNRKERLRMLIEEYWRNDIPVAIERDIDIDLSSRFIVDIVGPRRAGKTYLMYLTIRKLLEEGVSKKNTIYINFERRILYPLTPEYFNDLVEIIYEEGIEGKIYLFLDEVQRVNEWEKFVRSIYDEFGSRIKIFVSGSTSKLTSSAMSTLLTGRHITRIVLPLSFREFLRFRNYEVPEVPVESDIVKIKKLLNEYIEYGGFPEVVLMKRKEEYIETLFQDIVLRDVAPRVNNPLVLEDLAYFLTSIAGKLLSFSKLVRLLKARGIKISVPTLEKYFYFLKDAFLFFDTRIYSYRIRDQLQYPRKIYCVDTGFVNYFGFKFSEDRGRMLENLVALELLRRGKKIFYWKDQRGREVDFVVVKGSKVDELIQVSYDVSDPDTLKREVDAIQIASAELKCKKKTVITWDYEENGETRFVPLWKWLLERYAVKH